MLKSPETGYRRFFSITCVLSVYFHVSYTSHSENAPQTKKHRQNPQVHRIHIEYFDVILGQIW